MPNIFRALWSGELLSFTSTQFILFILPVIAISSLNLENSQVSAINVAVGVGTLSFLLLLQRLGDSHKKIMLLSLCSLIRALLCFSVSYLLAIGEFKIVFLFFFAFLISGITVFYDSLFSSLIPAVIDKKYIPRANRWFASLHSVADIVVGAAAGVAFGMMNSSNLFIIFGVLYALSLIGPVSAARSYRGVADTEQKVSEDTHTGYWAGLTFLVRDNIQFPLTKSIVYFNFITSGIQAVYIIYLLRNTDFSVLSLGVASSLGGVLGIILAHFSGRKIDTLKPYYVLIVTFLLPVVSGVGIYISQYFNNIFSIVIVGVSLALWSSSMMINISISETLKHLLVPHNVLGRFSMSQRLLTWGADPLGAVLSSFLLAYLQAGTVFIVFLLLLCVSPLWVIVSGEIRKLPVLSENG
ncbi:MFS transporter [Rothia sp. P13129]|uniref:MFS transporter n=1 Tax=Rothia sp. P13129 TaxID=3402664 RepID=UPI003AC1A42D